MESQDKEKEYRRKILGGFGEEWTTASPKKRIELNKRMLRWQELVDSGWTVTKAYFKVMEEYASKPTGKPLWSRMSKSVAIISALALVAAIVYSIVITVEIGNLKIELESVQSVLTSTQVELSSTKQTLSSTQSELTSTQTELSSTEQTLASTQTELASTQQTLTSVQDELVATKIELTSTESELASTENQLNSVQQDLTNLQDILSSTQQQLTVAQETLEGLGITLSASQECSDVDLIDSSTATNPTWGQLRAFLSQDQTDRNKYIENEYDCSQFSRDVHNNAEAAGIRAAEVHIEFRDESAAHALNAFLTSDYGLVYVDCIRIDTIARIKAEKKYRAVEVYRITEARIRNDYWWDALDSYYYIGSSEHDQWVTSSIKIYW